MSKSKGVRSSTTSSLPFGLGETFHVRTDSKGNRGVGRTPARAQASLQKSQARNRK